VGTDPAFARIRQIRQRDIAATGWTFHIARLNNTSQDLGGITWSHYDSDTGGIGWFPQNQYAPDDEWSRSGNDRRNRLGMYAISSGKRVICRGDLRELRNALDRATGTDLIWRRPVQHAA